MLRPPSTSSGGRRVRPQSAGARLSTPQRYDEFPPKPKSETQRNIDGEMGPAMIGVTTYPFSRSQRLYLQDFRALVAGTITHPYMSTASHGTPGTSVPHDLLAGSNFDDDRMGGFEKKFRSEHSRAYTVLDARARIVLAKTAASCGVRSEQMMG